MSWRSLTTSGGLDTGGSGCSYATFPHFEHRERWGTRQDIITADDRPIETLAALTAATYLHNPDKPVKLEILRGMQRTIKRRRFSTLPPWRSTTRWTC
jgi:S1-C subfamily serine protease